MQLLKHFKELSLHPKNAKELKGLILQLALQGKLTLNWREENPNPEHASILLKRVELEKADLIEEKSLSKEKVLDPINSKEILFDVPENWIWTRLGNIGIALTGTTPPTKNPANYGDFIPFIGPADISNSSMKYPVDGLSEEGLSKGRLIEADSLMMVCIGGSMGKCNINRKDVSCNQQINAIKPMCSPVDYIKALCQSPYFQNEVWDRSTGSATPMINKNKWLHIPAPIPPLEEQQAIVEVVNELFAEVEQLEELTKERISLKQDFATSALQRLTKSDNITDEWIFLQQHFPSFFTEKATIKKLRETILQLAVQGKLTAQWRRENASVENASELLKRIEAEKQQLIAEKKIKKEKALPSIEDEEKPYELPKGWEFIRLGTVTDIIAGASFKSGDFNETGGTKCIKITNAGVREFKETNDFLPENFHTKYPNYLIKEGDLVLALTRPYIKDGLKISICPGSYHNSLLNQRVASIRSMTENVYHPYIFTFIQSPKVLNHYKSMFDGKSQQPNMKMGDITELLISIPPLEEQLVIVDKVDSLMALCDELEQQTDNSQTQIEQLMQSCLKEVFEEN